MSIAILQIIFTVTVATVAGQNDPATHQLADYKSRTKGPIGTLTTAAGAPVEYKEASSVLNTKILTNEHFFDAMGSFVRERIPERVLHAAGVGAFGSFEVTQDISKICKAKLFSQVGKITPIAVRFSLGPSAIARPDVVRENRGFAIKFYTEEGNFDLLGLNSPMFILKDPILFTTFGRAFKSNPVTHLPDPNESWDFLTLNPETIHQFLYGASDYGTPANYRYMAGHPLHTYQVYNATGFSSFVRFHFIPDGGEKFFNVTELAKVAANDSYYYGRDLYDAIANGNYPGWSLQIQILSEDDVKKADYEAFDITKVLPTDQYPLHTVGRFVLNRNPVNNFAEVEQLAFGSGNLVPGILGSPDKIFETRHFVYRVAESYRLGGNFKKIPINCPIKALTYNRDGRPPVNDNGKDAPNYYPNSFNGPVPYVDDNKPSLIEIYEKPANNAAQISNFYANTLTAAQRSSVISVILKTLCLCESFLKTRAIKVLTTINSDLGNAVAQAVNTNCPN